MNFKENTLQENCLFDGKILKLYKDKVSLPNGNEGIREYVSHSGGSAILCVNEGKLLLVKQYRYAYREEVWEIPAGKLNPNEDPMDTAIRELEEEGGILADKVEKLFDVYPSPGYTNEVIRIYKAISFKKTKVHLDEDEFLTSKWVPLEEVKKMIENGEIKDSKSLIALLTVIR